MCLYMCGIILQKDRVHVCMCKERPTAFFLYSLTAFVFSPWYLKRHGSVLYREVSGLPKSVTKPPHVGKIFRDLAMCERLTSCPPNSPTDKTYMKACSHLRFLLFYFYPSFSLFPGLNRLNEFIDINHSDCSIISLIRVYCPCSSEYRCPRNAGQQDECSMRGPADGLLWGTFANCACGHL